MYRVEDLYKKYEKSLGLRLVAGKKGLTRSVKLPEVHCPGLSLSGYMKGYMPKRVLVFGKVEMEGKVTKIYVIKYSASMRSLNESV